MTKARPVVDLSAQCACGAVRVRLTGRIYAMFLCSCADCQKATGAGHSAVAIAAPHDVTIEGEARSFARTAESGATFTRHFCPTCGTPIFGTSSRAPDAIMLPAGLFSPDNDWFAPNQLIFARSHREWDTIGADLPRHQTYRQKGQI
jgi:hypothetical protein